MRYAALILYFVEEKRRFNCKNRKIILGAAPEFPEITIEIASAI